MSDNEHTPSSTSTRETSQYRHPEFLPGTPYSDNTTVSGVEKWYEPVVLTAQMVGERSCDSVVARDVLKVLQSIAPDDYVTTLVHYFTSGLELFGERWRYADLTTAIWAAAELIRPRAYLEIGVRRGRSMATLTSVQPGCDLYGFDYWKQNYAGMDNPGPEFVESELRRLGCTGKVKFISGNSHETVPQFLASHPELYFDMMTVDGDHSPDGAADDIYNVLPRLKIGGALLFDDISHPTHPELLQVWRQMIDDRTRFSVFEYTDLGYGVGVAVRKR